MSKFIRTVIVLEVPLTDEANRELAENTQEDTDETLARMSERASEIMREFVQEDVVIVTTTTIEESD